MYKDYTLIYTYTYIYIYIYIYIYSKRLRPIPPGLGSRIWNLRMCLLESIDFCSQHANMYLYIVKFEFVVDIWCVPTITHHSCTPHSLL